MFHRITAHDVTYPRGRGRMVIAYVNTYRRGERVVVCRWPEGTTTPDGLPEHPAGTITYARIRGVGVLVRHIESERVVTREELPPEIAERL